MTDKEIKELIIACIDRCAEHEIYSKDIMKEIYGYVERWTHSINKEELHKLANDEAEVYGLCFADSGDSYIGIDINNELYQSNKLDRYIDA